MTSITPDPRRWAALGVVLAAVFMDLIDISIVVIAAPAIQSDLRASYAGIQWIMAAYALALGLLLVTGGRLGDLVGRKRMFLVGVATFTLASAVCGLAPSIEVLIIARTVQGAAAAMMVPQVLTTILTEFPREERPKAFGMYGAANGLAAASAPIVGGLLVGNNVFGLEWRSVFWINVPVGLVAWIGGSRLMRESRAEHRTDLDLRGVAAVTAALLLLLYPLIQGPEHDWPLWGWLMMAASLPAFASFARTQASRERTGRFPLVPTSLFRTRSFVTGLAAALVMFSSIAAFFLVLTVQLQAGHGFSALRTGLTFMAWPIGLAITSGIAIRLVSAMGRKLISIGAAVLTAAMLATILAIRAGGTDLTSWHLVPGLLLGGVGFGFVAPVLVDIVLSGVPGRDAGAASGVTNTAIQIASAIGIALVGALFATAVDNGQDFDAAARLSLWYPVAAFALGFVLSFTLPTRAKATTAA